MTRAIEAGPLFGRLSRIGFFSFWRVDFGMNTVNNAANFNGQKPVIEADDAVLLLVDHYSALFPPYQPLIESYSKAQEVVTQHEQLDSVLA
jgi:hypothetical protein